MRDLGRALDNRAITSTAGHPYWENRRPRRRARQQTTHRREGPWPHRDAHLHRLQQGRLDHIREKLSGPAALQNIKTIVKVHERVEYADRCSFDTRYYISSAPLDIERIAKGREAIGASRACIGCSMSNSATIVALPHRPRRQEHGRRPPLRSRPRARQQGQGGASRHAAKPPVGTRRSCYKSCRSKSVNLDSEPWQVLGTA